MSSPQRWLLLHTASASDAAELLVRLQQARVEFINGLVSTSHTLSVLSDLQAQQILPSAWPTLQQSHQFVWWGAPTIELPCPTLQLAGSAENIARQIAMLAEMLPPREQPTPLSSDVIAALAHEFRTPLLQIRAGLDMLQPDSAAQPHNDHVLSIVEGAVLRLERLLDNFAMLGSPLTLSPGPLILRDAVRYTFMTLQRVPHLRSQVERVQVELGSNLPPILADKNGLLMVFHLLIENALRFSDGPVTLRAVRAAHDVEISVTDAGIGICLDHVNHVTDPFFQADRGSARRYGGLGIGLSVVRMIVERHNSTLDITTAPGVGTIVRFRLSAASRDV